MIFAKFYGYTIFLITYMFYVYAVLKKINDKHKTYIKQ